VRVMPAPQATAVQSVPLQEREAVEQAQ